MIEPLENMTYSASGTLRKKQTMNYEPKRVTEIYIVVRQDDETAPSYAPRSSEVRSKKFWALREAINLMNVHERNGVPAKLFRAYVEKWEEL